VLLEEVAGPGGEVGDVGVRLKQVHDYEWRLCAHDFWYWLQFVKTDDEDSGEIRDFPVHYDLPNLLQRISNHLDFL